MGFSPGLSLLSGNPLGCPIHDGFFVMDGEHIVFFKVFFKPIRQTLLRSNRKAELKRVDQVH